MAAVCDLPSVLVVEGGDSADALERRLSHFGHRVFTAVDAAVFRRPPRPYVDPTVCDDGTVVSGVPVRLTPIERRVLKALTANPGRVLSPEQLGQLVWGRLSRETADNARLYVSYLRAKIEQDTAHPELIETVRGRGYRYRAMAPGGVEPPRADSKSAALSAELRGRAEEG